MSNVFRAHVPPYFSDVERDPDHAFITRDELLAAPMMQRFAGVEGFERFVIEPISGGRRGEWPGFWYMVSAILREPLKRKHWVVGFTRYNVDLDPAPDWSTFNDRS